MLDHTSHVRIQEYVSTERTIVRKANLLECSDDSQISQNALKIKAHTNLCNQFFSGCVVQF